jgi:hypothetical protein
MSDFNWNKKRTVQTITPNRVIQSVQLSPKEVVASGGNRIQQDQVLASICVIAMELIEMAEATAQRIDSIYRKTGDSPNAASRVQPEGSEPTE